MIPSSGFLRVIAVWMALGWALAFFERAIWDAVWVFALYIWVMYALTGVVLLIVSLFVGWRATRSWRGLAYPGVVLAAGAVVALSVAPLVRTGDHVGFAIRFKWMRPTYDRIVAETERRPPPDTGHVPWVDLDQGKVRYSVDLGPPLRIAFVQPGGIIDNWEGVVYDPSGAVGSATGWREDEAGSFSAPPEVVGLFGGDLVGCRRVAEHYFRCWFT